MFWFEIPLLDLVFSSDRWHFFSFILRDENPSAVSGLLDYTRSVLYCVDLHITCCDCLILYSEVIVYFNWVTVNLAGLCVWCMRVTHQFTTTINQPTDLTVYQLSQTKAYRKIIINSRQQTDKLTYIHRYLASISSVSCQQSWLYHSFNERRRLKIQNVWRDGKSNNKDF